MAPNFPSSAVSDGWIGLDIGPDSINGVEVEWEVRELGHIGRSGYSVFEQVGKAAHDISQTQESVVTSRLFNLTDKGYKDNKQHEKNLAQIGDLDLQPEDAIVDRGDQAKSKRLIRKRNVSPLNVTKKLLGALVVPNRDTLLSYLIGKHNATDGWRSYFNQFNLLQFLWVMHHLTGQIQPLMAVVTIETGCGDLVRVPRLKGERVGVFATRSPHRLCSIGLTVAKVEAVHGHTVLLSSVDLVDGTPVLDIKPYLPYCDNIQGAMVVMG
ncbi:phosphoglycerate kinase family protein [Striga asiatica]|uniref:Phosphoglycerate kinase family protein n=1 Tax=Striga asiatica TaxID=4170 RepID=A0A5A7PZP7_STRAF|nr:phosphoglycerate kinase family protein [Striga asiatica]